MKLLANSTKIFIETLERQAVKRTKVKDPATGKIITKTTILDEELYNIYTLYKQNKIKFQDHVIEISAVTAALTSVDFLKTSDNVTIGVRNLAQAKLPENEYFCPVAITMVGTDALASNDEAGIQSAEFAPIDTLNSITGAWLDFKINTTEYLFRELPTGRFIGLNASGGQDAPKGTIFLDNTSIMKPQHRNELSMKSGVAMPATSAVKFLIHGTRTTPVGK